MNRAKVFIIFQKVGIPESDMIQLATWIVLFCVKTTITKPLIRSRCHYINVF